MVPRIHRQLFSAAWSAKPQADLSPVVTLANSHPALHGALRRALDSSFQVGLTLEADRAAKPDRAWSLTLPGHVDGHLRRPSLVDAGALALFLSRTPTGMDPRPTDPTGLVERVKELLWQSAAAGEDAFVLAGGGRVLGFAAIDRSPEPCELPLDPSWLSAHGLAPEDVCISRMALAGELRGLGLGHHFKQAQVTAAGDAGYLAVASPGGNRLGRALAARAGGFVQTAAASGWVLVPTARWQEAGKPHAH